MAVSGRCFLWLPALADPAGPRSPLPLTPLRPRDLPPLADLADVHGVLPAVVANLKAAGVLVSAPGAEVDAMLTSAARRLAHRTGLALMLRMQAEEIAGTMAQEAVAAVLLKGPDFAARLYPRPALRLFADIDLLVAESAAPRARRVMQDLGYKPVAAAMKYNAGYGEESWRRPDRPGGTVELHWNLVNSPTLRRAVSVKLEDLALEDVPAWAGRRRPTAAAVLLIAAVHGAASHAFDRLQILYDVAQAVRGAAGPLDEAWLAGAVRRTGATLSLSTALRLAETTLPEPRAGELGRRLGLPAASWMARLALTPAVVLRAHAARDGLRRQAFRELLKRS
jgi:hypothetical protein